MEKNKKENLEQEIRKAYFIRKVFIICSVRNLTPEENEEVKAHLEMLERRGIEVHYPPRDTNQNDPIGLNICSENRAGIKTSEYIHMYYNPASEGTIFDTGMTFMAEKPLFIINADNLKRYTSDNFEEFLLKYAFNIRSFRPSRFYEKVSERRGEIKKAESIGYEWKENSCDFLFDFGMSFAAEKPIYLINRNELKPTEGKSFVNVLLALDKLYREKKAI